MNDSPRAEYEYGFEGDVLWIIDVGVKTRSVTNDMLNVLNDIKEIEKIDLPNYRVIYRDSTGNWDGVIPHVESHGMVFQVGFYPLNTRNKDEAVRKAR